MLMGLFILVPTVCTIVCSAFDGTAFDNGDGTVDRFLTADLSIEMCHSCSRDRIEISEFTRQYLGIFIYALLMVLVFPVTIFTPRRCSRRFRCPD